MAIQLLVESTRKSARVFAAIAVIVGVLASGDARANDPEAYVRSIADKLEPLLQNGHLTAENVDAFLKANIFEELDMKRIARYVLRAHWSTIGEKDRQKFIEIFRVSILENFKKQLVKYAKAEIKIIRSVEHAPAGVSVITRVRVPSKSPVNMNWRLYRVDDGLKIFDVSVQGISRLSATRAEYKAVLEQHGFDRLIKEICARLEQPQPKAC
ncbi:MAG: ABC transporter substrate-binding protein [Alphaproteobacteria bacterium]|nr:ABC transporter substrate-binding protein [Alphaproteobacteria bacterium]